MYEICLFTKTIRLFVDYEDFIEDIVILQATDNDVQLLLQTKSVAQGCCNLKIADLPCKFLVFISVNGPLDSKTIFSCSFSQIFAIRNL